MDGINQNQPWMNFSTPPHPNPPQQQQQSWPPGQALSQSPGIPFVILTPVPSQPQQSSGYPTQQEPGTIYGFPAQQSGGGSQTQQQLPFGSMPQVPFLNQCPQVSQEPMDWRPTTGFPVQTQQKQPQQFVFGSPVQSQPQQIFYVHPQGVPSGPQSLCPGRGAASPLAVEYLRSIGINYQPTQFLPPPSPSPLPHPSTIFPSIQGGPRRTENDKFVLVDVEALARVLKRGGSMESIPREYNHVNNPQEEFRNRLARERNRLLTPPSSRVEDVLDSPRTPWFPGIQSLRPSLFEKKRSGLGEGGPTGQSHLNSGFGYSRTPLSSGPPRTNEGRGSWTNLLTSTPGFNWNSHNQNVENHPHRFPAQTTILPQRSRSSEVSFQSNPDRGCFNGNDPRWRNLSLNSDPFL